jgi:NAD(P)-dependent dehydrogenase (short-subunit alcohol dehydrogenase family)
MFESRVSIVTGEAGSIGSAVASKLAAVGHHIVIIDRTAVGSTPL